MPKMHHLLCCIHLLVFIYGGVHLLVTLVVMCKKNVVFIGQEAPSG